MCCVADILLLYSRFQKKLQDNKCTYFDSDDSVENIINRLEMLKGQNLLGSLEGRFTANFKPSEQRFLGIQLFQKTREGLLVGNVPCLRSLSAVVALPYRHNLVKETLNTHTICQLGICGDSFSLLCLIFALTKYSLRLP